LHRTNEEVRQQFNCDFELQGAVTDNSRLFLGVYSEFKAGAKAELIHLPSKQVYWQASHSLVKRSGGVPIGLISSITGAANATKNLAPDQAVRVSYELASKLVNSIPRLDYESQQARVAEHLVVESTQPSAELTSHIKPHQSEPAETLVRALNHQKDGRHEQATADFILAIAQGDSTESPLLGLGQSYAALGRFDMAAVAYEKAYQLNESNIDALVMGGIAHYASGDSELAYERLMDALIKSLASNNKTVARRAVNAMHSTGLYSQLSAKDQSFLESQL
jgi:tetratricopeptide (TPR) repeat protein